MASVAKHINRTCIKCGIKKPANRIYSKTVKKSYTGSSRRSINGMTLIGGFLGNKGAQRAFQQYLWQSSNRKYGGSATKQINLCRKCYHSAPSHNRPGILKLYFFSFYYIPKFLLTSPVVRELVIYTFGIFVWLFTKLLKFLGFLGIKILDQDGDGDLDKKDLEIAYQRVASFFSRFKNKKTTENT
jgi:hypothetical protein